MGRNDAWTIRGPDWIHVRDEAGLKQGIGYVSPELNYQPWGTVNHVLRFHRGFYPDRDDEYCRNPLESLWVGGHEKTVTLSFGARIKLGLIVANIYRDNCARRKDRARSERWLISARTLRTVKVREARRTDSPPPRSDGRQP